MKILKIVILVATIGLIASPGNAWRTDGWRPYGQDGATIGGDVVISGDATFGSISSPGIIGGTTPAAATVTNFTATTIDASGNATVGGTLGVTGALTATTAKFTTGAGDSKVLTSDADGDATWENAPTGTVPDSGTDTEAILIGDGAGSWNVVSGIAVTAYGVRWDASADTYVKGVIINRAGTFLPITYTNLPIQSQMRRCLLNDAGAVQYYLCATNSAQKADCSTASVLTGADGQVMVEIPQFYYLQHQDGDYRYFMIAQGPFRMTLSTGETVVAVIHPAFYKGGSATPSDYLYIGAYEGSMYDDTTSAMVAPADVVTNMYASGDKFCSLSGEYPKTNETIVEFRAMAAARGTGWHQFDHVSQSALAALYLTEFSDFDSQTKIGNGRTALTNGDWVASEIHDGTNYGYIGLCGLSNGDGNVTNADNDATDLEVSESPAYMSYRGIENWYGNIWKFLDGANINNDNVSSKLYLCTDHTDYASSTTSNYTLAGDLAEADGYVLDFLDAPGIWPSAVGGSSSTYVCDYYYTSFDTDPAGGWRAVLVSGGANAGAAAGAFFVDSLYASIIQFTYGGGRLCF